MAGGGFTVTISAVDKLTRTLDDINKKSRETFRPFRELDASIRRFAGTTLGLRNVGNAMRDVGRSSRDAFEHVSSIVAPLGAITGAASIAGMYRMVSAWSQWGSQLRNTSQSIGMSAQKVAQWEGAAQIGGAAAGSMSSALQSLGQNMYDAVGGRNSSFVALMNGWGIAFRKTATQGRDVSEVFPQIADRIAKIKETFAQAQAAAIAFGGAGAAMLPYLRRGAAGMREYQAEAAKYLHVTAASAGHADQFRMSQTRLTFAVQGFANQLSDRLAPVLTPIIDKFADWLATSPQVTSAIDQMGQAVQEFAAWLRGVDWKGTIDWAKSLGAGIKSLVDDIGGPKRALEGFLLLMAANAVAGLIGPWLRVGLAIWGVAARLDKATAAMLRFTAAEKVAEAGSIGGAVSRAAGLASRAGWALAAGAATHEALNAADPNDRIGSWVDQNAPGASWLDNQASRIGLGRSYAEQTMASAGAPYKAGLLLKDTGASQRQYDIFARSVAGIERAGYGQMGGAGGHYAGRYQMSAGAISDAAHYLGEQTPTQSQFLSDNAMQERFFEANTDLNSRYLSAHSAMFKSASTARKLAVLGYAHNQGMGGALKWLQTGQAGHDAFGTDGTRYSDSVTANLATSDGQDAAIFPIGAPSGPALSVASAHQVGTGGVANGTMTVQVQAAPGTSASVLSKDGALKDARVVQNNVTDVGP
ncbi:phage tail tape measure protein [Acetobacter oeni]|uniref:Phage tail lysozyme domain-containing protein n=1 Tax=Acetobacter oeni TaxID=304077 RepID=A0A511XP61_9PROT|nr:hypothetical protein [Acetobacter oeni]MBB3884493.1 hypothetical protein [Acetobacter oeni]NHO20425.1 hypothetical protein [Acetobacter oeni]GBR00546.1 hypothetical protein AA21952_0139 [Acetobacter oeni LMG 21952]GEN64696.1 hypothetical protein AOE01nite_29200 [Acetobacter oeni]